MFKCLPAGIEILHRGHQDPLSKLRQRFLSRLATQNFKLTAIQQWSKAGGGFLLNLWCTHYYRQRCHLFFFFFSEHLGHKELDMTEVLTLSLANTGLRRWL